MATSASPMNYQSFIDYLLTTLRTPHDLLISQYDGPSDWRITQIQQSLASMVNQIHRNPSSDLVYTSQTGSVYIHSFRDDPLSSNHHDHAQQDRTNRHKLLPQSLDHSLSDSVPADDIQTAVSDRAVEEALKLVNAQISDVIHVCSSVTKGDLSPQMGGPAVGPVMVQLRDVVNGMMNTLNYFAAETAHSVSGGIGFGGLGEVPINAFQGVWRGLVHDISRLAVDSLNQVRATAIVSKAVASGDLSREIDIEAVGEILELKVTVNSMVADLRAFAAEVNRVTTSASRGVLAEHINLPDAKGIWLDLTNNINSMMHTMTNQIRSAASVVRAVARGDLTYRSEVDGEGELFEFNHLINVMVDRIATFASEVSRVTVEIGTSGLLGGQATTPDVDGTWSKLLVGINTVTHSLTSQVRLVSEVTKAVIKGDLSMRITVDGQGEMLDLKTDVNEMVEHLARIASEISRVSLEVGTEGKLGTRTHVPNASGTWQDVLTNVDMMSTNLRTQVRSVVDVTGAVANGSLNRRVTADLRGDMLDLKVTVNEMADSLNGFTDDVNRTVKEVLSSASRLTMTSFMRSK